MDTINIGAHVAISFIQVTKRLCETEKRYEKECKKVWKENCETVYVKKCYPSYKQKCTQKEVEKCSPAEGNLLRKFKIAEIIAAKATALTLLALFC